MSSLPHCQKVKFNLFFLFSLSKGPKPKLSPSPVISAQDIIPDASYTLCRTYGSAVHCRCVFSSLHQAGSYSHL